MIYIVNYFAAYYVDKKTTFIKVNPILYALGAMALGGIYPLIFLVIKYMYCSYKKKNSDKGEE